MKNSTSGFIAALGAFFVWGAVLPLYLKSLSSVPALELVSYRFFLPAIMLGCILVFRRKIPDFIKACKSNFWPLFSSSTIGGLMVAVFIWAAIHGRLIESSLGYFMGPLTTALFAYLFLKENFNGGQKIAIALACIAILVLVMNSSGFPFIPLTIAFANSGYALAKRKTTVTPLQSTTFEVLLLSFPCVAILTYYGFQTEGLHLMVSLPNDLYIWSYAAVSILPVFLFAYAAQHTSMLTLGFMSYLNPTFQFLLAIVVNKEPTSTTKLTALVLVWIALGIYSYSNFKRQKMAYTNQPQKAA